MNANLADIDLRTTCTPDTILYEKWIGPNLSEHEKRMAFPGGSFNPEKQALLTQAFDAAWQEVLAALPRCIEADMLVTCKMIALRIMIAANAGESDPERLKTLALQAVNGTNFD